MNKRRRTPAPFFYIGGIPDAAIFGSGQGDGGPRGYGRGTGPALGGLAGVPAVAIVGGMGKGAEEIYRHGISSIVTTINGPMRTEEAMERAEELYSCAARRMFRLFEAGTSLRK